MPSVSSGSRILAVAALYKQSPSESRALSSYISIMQANEKLASQFSLVVYDNSPEVQQARGDFAFEYVHDPSNGGLVAAYEYALARAEKRGCEWLLLLDQDTILTPEFFFELTACMSSLRVEDNVAAIVPKLMAQGIVQSPEEHFIDYIRHQFTRSIDTSSREVVGVQHDRINAYNSGSTLRVLVLRSLGGFPKEFWLDYLDHAIFHALFSAGYHVYVLRAVLKHDLGGGELNTLPIWRFRNMLKAQTLFVKRVGNLGDRLLYRLWLLRSVRRLRADCYDKRMWKETALQALLFSAPSSSASVRPPTITSSSPQ
jgi:GT2 family glycosyltransferase